MQEALFAEAMPLNAEAMPPDAEAMPLHVVTLQGKSKSIAVAMEKLCFYKVKPILLQAKRCPFIT